MAEESEIANGSLGSSIGSVGNGDLVQALPMAEWSEEEVLILKLLLKKYASERSLVCCQKIACFLPNKTATDVAIRCKQMQAKRSRKSDMAKEDPGILLMETINGLKRFKLKTSANIFPEEKKYLSDLLESNNEIFLQIYKNSAAYSREENIKLFKIVRDNINNMLHSIRKMCPVFEQMELPGKLHNDLLNFIQLRQMISDLTPFTREGQTTIDNPITAAPYDMASWIKWEENCPLNPAAHNEISS